jgi:hypothetical protein
MTLAQIAAALGLSQSRFQEPRVPGFIRYTYGDVIKLQSRFRES